MNMEMIERFLFWSMVLNICCSVFAFIAVLVAKNVAYRIHGKIFKVSEEVVAEKVYKAMLDYKSLFVFFNVIPYIVIQIIK